MVNSTLIIIIYNLIIEDWPMADTIPIEMDEMKGVV